MTCYPCPRPYKGREPGYESNAPTTRAPEAADGRTPAIQSLREPRPRDTRESELEESLDPAYSSAIRTKR